MRGRLIWGISLIVLGLFFLMNQLDWFGAAQFPLPVFLFGFLALAFLLTFISNPRQWWPLIPGGVMLGLTLLVLNDQNKWISSTQAAGLFLLCIGVPFLLISVIDRRQWWGLIPGGVLSVIALIVFISDRPLTAQTMTALIFFGLAIIFALIRVVTRANPWMGWATWVAIILAAIGALVLITGPQAASVVGPLALIALGLLLLGRSLWARSQSRH